MNFQGIIDNIIELASDRLNDWESDFINDVNTKYANKDKLSDRQKEIILKIQRKYLIYS